MAQGGDKAARVDGEEGLGFLVGVDFDVLVGDALVFEGDPDALDEGAVGIVVSGGCDVMGVIYGGTGGCAGGMRGGRLTRMHCRRA